MVCLSISVPIGFPSGGAFHSSTAPSRVASIVRNAFRTRVTGCLSRVSRSSNGAPLLSLARLSFATDGSAFLSSPACLTAPLSTCRHTKDYSSSFASMLVQKKIPFTGSKMLRARSAYRVERFPCRSPMSSL